MDRRYRVAGTPSALLRRRRQRGRGPSGAAAALARSPTTRSRRRPRQVRSAVLVDGPLPAGAFSLDVPGRRSGRRARRLTSSPRSARCSPRASRSRSRSATSRSRAARRRARSRRSRRAGSSSTAALKPDLAAPGVSVPTSEPGRGDDGEVRFGTISGTSAAAAVTAGRRGRRRARSAGARTRVGSTACSSARRQRADLDPTASGAGLVDLRAAVQQEVDRRAGVVVVRRRRRPRRGERTIRITNVSTRRVSVSVGVSAIAPKGVEIEVDPQRVPPPAGTKRGRRRPREHDSPCPRRRAPPPASSCCAAATRRRCTCRGRSRCRPPSTSSPGSGSRRRGRASPTRRRLRCRSSRASVTAAPDPQVRAVELLEVQLRRNEELIGVLARRRELLPGRYTFGLTGRGPTGERLGRGPFTIRLVAYPGDGTRRQIGHDRVSPSLVLFPAGRILGAVQSSQEAQLDVNGGGGVPSPREPVRAGQGAAAPGRRGLRPRSEPDPRSLAVQEGRGGLDPRRRWTTGRSRSTRASASPTTSRAARRRAASATTRTSRSTRSSRCRCG